MRMRKFSGKDHADRYGRTVTPFVALRVLDGMPEHRDLYLTPHEQAANDRFMPCCSRSLSPRLVLDLYPLAEVDPLDALITDRANEAKALQQSKVAAQDPLDALIAQHTQRPPVPATAMALHRPMPS